MSDWLSSTAASEQTMRSLAVHPGLAARTAYGESLGPLFTMYLAEEGDSKRVEQWQKDSEGTIIFVRPKRFFRLVVPTDLFSAAVVAALIFASIQDLRPNSQDTSAFYFEKRYQL